MGRTRTFADDKVLDAAMHAFRRKGYGGISIKRLEAETGLTSGSLYNAYGSKENLFGAALAHYVEGFVAQRLKTHAGETATLEDLEQFLLSLLRPPLSDGFGCLVVNSAVEFGPVPSPTARLVADTLNDIRSAFTGVLAREIGPDRAEATAARLHLLYNGLLVLSRTGEIDAAAAAAITAEFDALRATRRAFFQQKGDSKC